MSADLQERLLEEAKKIVEERVVLKPGDVVAPGIINLGLYYHGAKGNAYLAGRVIVDRGDAQEIIDKILKHTRIQQEIGLLKRAITSRTRKAEDEMTNRMSVSAAKQVLDEYRKLIVRGNPIHNRDDIKKLGGKSEIGLGMLKWIDKEDYDGRSSVRELMFQEIALTSRANHPNVAYHIMPIDQKKGMGQLIEFIDGRNLADIVNDVEILKISDLPPKAVVFALAYEIFNGVQGLHEIGIIHNDIKPANIMLRLRNGTLKITDLGLAREHNKTEDNYSDKFMTDAQYSAPEVLEHTERGKPGSGSRVAAKSGARIPFNPKTDTWMAGITIDELARGKPAFREADFNDFKEEVMGMKHKSLPGYTQEENHTLSLALQKDPSKRPEAGEIRDRCFYHLVKLGYNTPHKIHELRRTYVLPILNARDGEYVTQIASVPEVQNGSFAGSMVEE